MRLHLHNSSSFRYRDEILSCGVTKRNRYEANIHILLLDKEKRQSCAYAMRIYPCNLQWAAYPFASARRDWALPLSNLAASAFRSCVCLLFFFLPFLFSIPRFFDRFPLLDTSRYRFRRPNSINDYCTKSLEFDIHPYRKLLLMCLSGEILIESRFFNELYCAVAGGSTRDKAIRDPEPTTATYFESDVERSIHLAARSEIKARAIIGTYEYTPGQFLRKTYRICMYTMKYLMWIVSTRIILSLDIRDRIG